MTVDALRTELKLAIRADTKVAFGQIVKVTDATKQANVKAVNAFTKEAGKYSGKPR